MRSTKRKAEKTKVDISEKDLKSAKVRVTTFLDLEVLRALKAEAEKKGSKYQTLMNQRLRDSLFGRSIDDHMRQEIKEMIQEEIKKQSA